MTVPKIIEIHDRDCLTYNTRLKNLKHITCIIFNHRQSRVWLEGWEFWHLDPDREAQSAAAADVLPALLAAADAEPRRHGGGALHDGQHEGPRHGRGPDQRGRDVQLLHHVLGGWRSAHEEAHLLLFGKSVWSHSFKRIMTTIILGSSTVVLGRTLGLYGRWSEEYSGQRSFSVVKVNGLLNRSP